MKRSVLFIIALMVFCAALTACKSEKKNEDLTIAKTYTLENATERQKMERMATFSLYEDGTMTFAPAYISSYIPPRCTYSVEDGEMVFRAIIETEHDKGFFGLENGDIVAVFSIADENTLVFVSANVVLFPEPNGRYVAD